MAERKPHSLSEPLDDAIGPLRHKLAKPELARVNDVARRGLRALLLHARELDVRAAADAQRLRALTAALEREPNRARPLIEQYLTETAPSPEALRADRRALSAGESSRLNLATLAERVATKVFRIELECELALAVLRSRCHEPEGSTLDVQAIASLALRPGRWSRRAEAFALLRTLAQSALPAEARRQILDACLEGARLEQHRWVQVAAVEAMAGLDAERALALVRDRLAHPQSGDDFLVRERFVELAARLPHDTWHVVLEAGAKDTSEHVRLTAARTVRDPAHLAHMATRAESDKVRALALVSLAKRTGASAQPTLIAALASDRSPLAVEAAAEALVLLARRNVLRDRKPTEEALARTAARMDLPSRTRAVVLEELSTLAVLATPYLRLVHDLVASAVAEIPVGGSGQLVGQALSGVSEEEMGRLLSALSRGDFGLCAERISDGYIVHRGEARAFSSWRWLFELLHPLPTKRQGYTHTWARRVRGQLRAPPQGLAELSATAVPGERLLVGARGDWGRHLPLVDDLLHTGVFFPQPARIVSPQGTTIVTPPDSLRGRLAAWAQLSLHYAGFAKQRHRSLDSDEPAVQRGFVDSVQHETGIRIDFVPHPFTEGLPKPAEFGTGPIEPASAQSPQRAMTSLFALPTLSAFRMFDGLARDFFHYSVSPEGNRLPHVGAYAATLLVGMIARGVVARRRIDADRKAIPLVVGGWGTRGKSGTERLKAGLFQGLGYEVLVKTTGCEAMFIHGIPGLRAQEVFIYRPYDKATVWEQRSLLRLARRFDVQVFLWECMALQPDLVNLLQAQWMRDDYSTITNAYPDHEDIQGPAGYDVAETISEFVPTGGRLFTTEDQMLPLLRERAKARGTSVRAIPPREASLIGDDILARFPYQEHPNNIALVSALAQALGVSASVALARCAQDLSARQVSRSLRRIHQRHERQRDYGRVVELDSRGFRSARSRQRPLPPHRQLGEQPRRPGRPQ